jgi:hypothetical protein
MNNLEYEYVYMNRYYDIDVMYIIHDDSYIHIILYSHIYIYTIYIYYIYIIYILYIYIWVLV